MVTTVTEEFFSRDENQPQEGEDFLDWEVRVEEKAKEEFGEMGSDWYFGTHPAVWWSRHWFGE